MLELRFANYRRIDKSSKLADIERRQIEAAAILIDAESAESVDVSGARSAMPTPEPIRRSAR